jgi:hypothetical protein
MRSFAKVLIELMNPAKAEAAAAEDAEDGTLKYDDLDEQLVTTGYAEDASHFMHMLAEATRATIVGVTNEQLLPMLQEALSRKRSNGRAEAFWDSLRIVFLGKNILPGINDEREEVNDPEQSLSQRYQASFWAYKQIGAYLKRTSAAHWALYKCPYIPAVTGTLFEFADHTKIAQLMIRRARRPAAENIYVDLEDHKEMLSAVFQDIVEHSASNYNVPVGVPTDTVFQCTGLRLHSTVLRDGSRARGWLPMVLVVTTMQRAGQVEPILQIRSVENSARELNRLSHLGGHILQEDCGPASGQAAGRWIFGLTDDIPVHAATRLVSEMTATDPAGGLRPAGKGGYLHSDKENLFFFVFSLKLPETAQFPWPADMHAFPLPELIAIRANQVLRSAAQLCRMDVSERAWNAATEVLALNLTLHDHAELGDRLLQLRHDIPGGKEQIAQEMSGLVTGRASPSWALADSEAQLTGLAGWQFREFFPQLLPLYARLGVQGAADLQHRVDGDADKRHAQDRLKEIYQDETRIALMPIEL